MGGAPRKRVHGKLGGRFFDDGETSKYKSLRISQPTDLVQLERNMLLPMPGGWKMAQLDPQHLSTTYAEFKREILNEIARCLNLPHNIAAGKSSGHNYASGHPDHQTCYKAVRVDQASMGNRAAHKADQLFFARLPGDPPQVDTFETGHLRGKRTPTIEKVNTDFNTRPL